MNFEIFPQLSVLVEASIFAVRSDKFLIVGNQSQKMREVRSNLKEYSALRIEKRMWHSQFNFREITTVLPQFLSQFLLLQNL
jgi:hypothetical protein